MFTIRKHTLPPLSAKASIALVNAVEATFDASNWAMFALEIGNKDIANQDYGLLRALRFGDDHYGALIVKLIQELDEEMPEALRSLARHPKVRKHLEKKAPVAAAELGLSTVQVASPVAAPSASEVVEHALDDAEHLLQTRGPVSCVDRMHTALHGYLRDECARAKVIVAADANLPQLFKALRLGHPKLSGTGPQGPHIERVLQSLAAAIDTLNTMRNSASMAHPTETLLGKSEAMLMVNVSRSLFNYLRERLG